MGVAREVDAGVDLRRCAGSFQVLIVPLKIFAATSGVSVRLSTPGGCRPSRSGRRPSGRFQAGLPSHRFAAASVSTTPSFSSVFSAESEPAQSTWPAVNWAMPAPGAGRVVVDGRVRAVGDEVGRRPGRPRSSGRGALAVQGAADAVGRAARRGARLGSRRVLVRATGGEQQGRRGEAGERESRRSVVSSPAGDPSRAGVAVPRADPRPSAPDAREAR